jgi:hypothetical protein
MRIQSPSWWQSGKGTTGLRTASTSAAPPRTARAGPSKAANTPSPAVSSVAPAEMLQLVVDRLVLVSVADNPAKLDLDWLKDRLPDAASKLFDKAS